MRDCSGERVVIREGRREEEEEREMFMRRGG